jgi:outer membrane scaffolding protein for murein synthesis (MipA/OmpV family)
VLSPFVHALDRPCNIRIPSLQTPAPSRCNVAVLPTTEVDAMPRFTPAILLAAGLCINPPGAASAAVPEGALPTAELPDLAADGEWALAVGAEAEYSVDYDGSDDYETELQPGLIAHLRRGDLRYYLEGNSLGVRWTPSPDWLLGLGLQYEFGRSEDDNPALRGLGDTDDEPALTLDVRRGFGAGWPWWLAARVLAGDSDLGALAVVGLGREIPVPSPRWTADVVLYATFATSEFQRKDFGVTRAQSVTSGYAAFEPSGGYRALGLQSYLQYVASKRLLVRAEAGYEGYSSSVRDSPIVRAGSDGEFEVSLTLLYRVW